MYHWRWSYGFKKRLDRICIFLNNSYYCDMVLLSQLLEKLSYCIEYTYCVGYTSYFKRFGHFSIILSASFPRIFLVLHFSKNIYFNLLILNLSRNLKDNITTICTALQSNIKFKCECYNTNYFSSKIPLEKLHLKLHWIIIL